jgi:hypothetical protein
VPQTPHQQRDIQKWKVNYSGREVLDVKRLKALEGENAKLNSARFLHVDECRLLQASLERRSLHPSSSSSVLIIARQVSSPAL